METVLTSISRDIARLAPGFRALSITVDAAPVRHPDIAAEALHDACQAVLAGEPDWAEAHLCAWQNVFRQFGAKPKRTPCSAEALRKRVLRDGALPAIDPVVDLYNAVSLRYALPIGGENLAAYVGAPRLKVADGTESFDTLKEGQPVSETVDAGEVIWCDDVGVTCRRWNWRQGLRTRLSASDRHMWFILESLPPLPPDTLQAAGDALIEGLTQLMPGARFSVTTVTI